LNSQPLLFELPHIHSRRFHFARHFNSSKHKRFVSALQSILTFFISSCAGANLKDQIEYRSHAPKRYTRCTNIKIKRKKDLFWYKNINICVRANDLGTHGRISTFFTVAIRRRSLGTIWSHFIRQAHNYGTFLLISSSAVALLIAS